jgi:predicted DNA-binding transcriptional regulator AlpA
MPGVARLASADTHRPTEPSSPQRLLDALDAFLRTAPVDAVPDLIAQLEGLKARLYARLSAPGRMAAPTKDRLLTVKEAAEKMRRSADWLYRHSATLPFAVREGRLLRFSEQGIEEYIRRRMGG